MKSLDRARDADAVLRRLARVRPESARRWGRMSAPQMVCHLADAFRMALGEHPVSHASGLFERTLLKWTALYLPVRWPEGIVTRPEIDQGLGRGTCPGDFAADVEELRRLVQRMIASAPALDGRRHPVFGRMSRAAWLRWGYLHMDHHLRQFGA
jgi:hypothetical protein